MSSPQQLALARPGNGRELSSLMETGSIVQNSLPSQVTQGAATARSRLEDMGYCIPEWGALARGLRPEGFPVEEEVGPRHVGWMLTTSSRSQQFWARRSQVGSLARLPFVCCPTFLCVRLEAQVFRVFCAAFGPHFLPLSAPAGVAVYSTLMATTVQAYANVGVLGRQKEPLRL